MGLDMTLTLSISPTKPSLKKACSGLAKPCIGINPQKNKGTAENTMWIGDTMPRGPSTFQNDTFDSISRARLFFCLKILGAGVVMVKVHCWWLKQCLDTSASWFKANSQGEHKVFMENTANICIQLQCLNPSVAASDPRSSAVIFWLLNATSSVAMMQMMILMVLIMLVWCFPSLVCILHHRVWPGGKRSTYTFQSISNDPPKYSIIHNYSISNYSISDYPLLYQNVIYNNKAWLSTIHGGPMVIDQKSYL